MKKIVAPLLVTASFLVGGGGLVNPELAHATSKTNQSVKTTSAYKTITDLNLRSGASKNHKKILTIPKGQTVKYISKSGSWYKISYKGQTGYALSSYLKKISTHKTTTTYKTITNLNLRSGAGTSHKKLLTIPKGQVVKYISKSGSWYKVSYKGKTGYVLSSYLKKIQQSNKVPANTNWISKTSAEKILIKEEYKKRTDRSYVYERYDEVVIEVLFYGFSSAKADLIIQPLQYLSALDPDISEVGEENYKEWKKVLEIFNKKITTYAITQIDEKYANDLLKEVQNFALTSKRKDVVVKRIGGKDFVFKNTGEFRIEPK
ncbi:SH3 domain-containing protein [Exiguobacterium sp. s161]|uniref:SH3 domain-containing protein n=1 Tax=Exiguobacterium sp. s161 TaxID=2751191 RepID=UPI001BE927C6|nr:SH3 domain-containing protein [Exiguobacterium sp. s161]